MNTFYLHNSHKGYTHGCVETCDDLYAGRRIHLRRCSLRGQLYKWRDKAMISRSLVKTACLACVCLLIQIVSLSGAQTATAELVKIEGRVDDP